MDYDMMATRLKHERSRQKRGYSVSMKKSADGFQQLIEKDGYDSKQVETVFNWYLTHMGDRYAANCSGGAEFRTKWISLLSAFGIWQENGGDVLVGTMAVRIHEKVAHLDWPFDRDEILRSIQIGITNHVKTRNGLRAAMLDKSLSRYHRFIKSLLTGPLYSVEGSFILDWMLNSFAAVRSSTTISSLKAYTFRVDHPVFRATMYRASTESFDTTKPWKKLEVYIKEEE